MYEALAEAYKELTDKSGINARDVLFHGFSGNEETKYLLYARFLRDRLGLWKKLDVSQSDDLDGHYPSLDKYRAMLDRWKASHDLYQLTKEDIVRIVGLSG
jgi:uncharacterized protein